MDKGEKQLLPCSELISGFFFFQLPLVDTVVSFLSFAFNVSGEDCCLNSVRHLQQLPW